MIDYYAPILLPSNGLEYEPIIYIKELTIGSIFIHYDIFYVNSEINKIVSILNNHFRHNEIKNITDMYYSDVIYIWNYLCNQSFNINKINKKFACENCKKIKSISLELKDININFLENLNIEKEFKVDEKFSIFYRRRKMIDNLYFSFYTLSENQENVEYIYNYTKDQVLYIKDNKKNKKIEKNNLKDLINSIGLNKAISFFKELRQEDFGFESDYNIICDSCNHKNEIKLVDPLDISFFYKGLEVENKEYQNFIETLMVISSLKYISFGELLELPNSKLNLIIDGVKKLQDQKYGKDKGGGGFFEQMMEDA